MSSLHRNRRILVAEDDPDDRVLLEEALSEIDIECEVSFVTNGEDLMDYITERGVYEAAGSAPRPALIILDLNMPRKDGREVLRELRSYPATQIIPVIVMTTSITEDDIGYTYELGASSYIVKPMAFEDLVETLRLLLRYWFELVKLPVVM